MSDWVDKSFDGIFLGSHEQPCDCAVCDDIHFKRSLRSGAGTKSTEEIKMNDEITPEVQAETDDAEHFNTMPAEDELEWLRGQYVELKGMLNSARQSYASAGQEAASLRRVLASRAPTVRELTAVAVLPLLLDRSLSLLQGMPKTLYARATVDDHVIIATNRAVAVADALVAALRGDRP